MDKHENSRTQLLPKVASTIKSRLRHHRSQIFLQLPKLISLYSPFRVCAFYILSVRGSSSVKSKAFGGASNGVWLLEPLQDTMCCREKIDNPLSLNSKVSSPLTILKVGISRILEMLLSEIVIVLRPSASTPWSTSNLMYNDNTKCFRFLHLTRSEKSYSVCSGVFPSGLLQVKCNEVMQSSLRWLPK